MVTMIGFAAGFSAGAAATQIYNTSRSNENNKSTDKDAPFREMGFNLAEQFYHGIYRAEFRDDLEAGGGAAKFVLDRTYEGLMAHVSNHDRQATEARRALRKKREEVTRLLTERRHLKEQCSAQEETIKDLRWRLKSLKADHNAAWRKIEALEKDGNKDSSVLGKRGAECDANDEGDNSSKRLQAIPASTPVTTTGSSASSKRSAEVASLGDAGTNESKRLSMAGIPATPTTPAAPVTAPAVVTPDHSPPAFCAQPRDPAQDELKRSRECFLGPMHIDLYNMLLRNGLSPVTASNTIHGVGPSVQAHPIAQHIPQSAPQPSAFASFSSPAPTMHNQPAQASVNALRAAPAGGGQGAPDSDKVMKGKEALARAKKLFGGDIKPVPIFEKVSKWGLSKEATTGMCESIARISLFPHLNMHSISYVYDHTADPNDIYVYVFLKNKQDARKFAEGTERAKAALAPAAQGHG